MPSTKWMTTRIFTRMPSASAMQSHPQADFDENIHMLKSNSIVPSKLPCGYVPVDMDVSPFDNSQTRKEGVSRTYQGWDCDGYAPCLPIPVEFVATMPGMTELSSAIVLAETGINMDIFDDAKHLCSWCGLSPANNESAGKKKSVRIAKAGACLKPMMVQMCPCCIQKQKTAIFCNQVWPDQKAPRAQESNHCHRKDDDGLYLPYGI